MKMRGLAGAVAAAVVLSVLSASVGTAAPPTSVVPAAEVSAAMRSVANAYVAAMAAHDIPEARRHVRAVSAAHAEFLLDWSEPWSSATSARCRGVICSASGATTTPEPAFLMRKLDGRWWVAGDVYFPSWGPWELLDSDILFDPHSGKRATAGLPSGTTYWVLDDKRNVSYLQVRRRGRTVRVIGRTPAVVRLYAEQFSCGAAMFKSDRLNVQGSAISNALPLLGRDESYEISGPVWRAGRMMHAISLAEAWLWVDGDGGTRSLVDWRRSTRKRTGGSGWTSVERLCESRT